MLDYHWVWEAYVVCCVIVSVIVFVFVAQTPLSTSQIVSWVLGTTHSRQGLQIAADCSSNLRDVNTWPSLDGARARAQREKGEQDERSVNLASRPSHPGTGSDFDEETKLQDGILLGGTRAESRFPPSRSDTTERDDGSPGLRQNSTSLYESFDTSRLEDDLGENEWSRGDAGSLSQAGDDLNGRPHRDAESSKKPCKSNTSPDMVSFS
eukprot:GSA120T00019959001.1